MVITEREREREEELYCITLVDDSISLATPSTTPPTRGRSIREEGTVVVSTT